MILETYRQSEGLSRAAMGKILGVSETTIFRWETGRSFPHRKTLHLIAWKTRGKVGVEDWLESL